MFSRAILPPREDGFARKKWSVSDCKFLTDSGLLEPGSYELIEGEIISKMGQSRRHIMTISRILIALTAIFGQDWLQNQAQIGIGERDEWNDPEPDIAVLLGGVFAYPDREPDPATEVLLLVEAASSSLKGDTTTKAAIYARHGLREYWVVGIAKRELIVHRGPTANGYTDVRTYAETDAVSPLARPGATVRITDLLP